MSQRRRRVLIRGVGIVGAMAQLLVGLMGIVIFPAAMVAVVTGVAGVRLVGRDLEAASMRFGVSLLASGVGVLFGFVSGAMPMIGTALLSTGCFALAWTGVQQLASEHRAAFGIKHRDWTRRDTELHERRAGLRNRRPDDPPARDGHADDAAATRPPGNSADDRAPLEDPDPWWEDLG